MTAEFTGHGIWLATRRMLRLETLKSLMIGDDVREVQKALVAHGIDIKVDGTYGPLTEAQVRQFQQRAGLKPDGFIGPATRSALGL